jgi:hypothetical protein
LRDFFASVQAAARIEGHAVVVSLPGTPGRSGREALAKACGNPVSVEVSARIAGI